MTAHNALFSAPGPALGETLPALQSALDATYDLLHQVSLTSTLSDCWVMAFGSNVDPVTAENLRLSGKIGILVSIFAGKRRLRFGGVREKA